MKSRCLRPSTESKHAAYAGRGITICDRWLESFENFLADMGERPEGKTLDRIDNDLLADGYSKSNCRWATGSEQQRNRRHSSEWRAKPGAALAARTHCKHGHLFDESNTRYDKNVRACRKCAAWRVAARRLAKRKGSPAQLNRDKTHCKRGHWFTDVNTYRTSNGGRACRECKRLHRINRKGRNVSAVVTMRDVGGAE